MRKNTDNPATDIASRVEQRLTELAYEKMPGALISTLIILVLMFTIIAYRSGWEILLPWIIVFLGVLSLRTATLLLFYRARKQQRVIRSAALLYCIGTMLTGCTWGGMIIWLLPDLDLNGSILLFVIVLGMASGAIPSMGYKKTAIIGFITLLVMSLIYVAIDMHIPNLFGVILTFLVYMVFLFRTAISFYDSVRDMLVLQEEAIDNEREILIQREFAQQANNAKSEFLSRVSHELRTPLNAVIGFTDLLQHDSKERLTEKQYARTDKIKQASEHLLDLVNDILDLSRIETGNLEISLQPVECKQQVKHVLALVESEIINRQIRVRIDIEDGMPMLLADAVRLKQVLFNLIDNAIKYNRRGGSVTIVQTRLDGERSRVSIIDTGYGLSEADRKKLFLPFSRPGTMQHVVEGTGIGLNYSKKLIELMDGEIGVDSRPGQGSSFWFELPVVEAAAPVPARQETGPSPATPVSVEKPPAEADDTRRPGRLLLVEDNAVNQEVAMDMLAQMGFRVDVANNGAEAIDAYCRNHYDLILMDCEMPVMGGVKATQAIREIERRESRKSVPVVALTAHAISGAREKCLESGMNDFLSKPFGYQAILSIVEKWTHCRAVSQAPPVADTGGEAATGHGEAGNGVLDRKVIERMRRSQQNRPQQTGKASLLSRVTQLYLQQMPALLGQMREALETGELTVIGDIAHSVKSSSAAIGALALADLARKIESSIREETPDMTEIKHRVSEIHHIYQQVADELQQILIDEQG